MYKNPYKSNFGFTLVELIVVMSIIGVIASMLLVSFQDARVRSRDAVRKADLRQVKSALQLYYNDHQTFPPSSSTSGMGATINGCGNNNPPNQTCSWGSPFLAAGINYMSVLPVDPLNTGNYRYTYWRLSADTYELRVYLENASDQDAIKSQQRCRPGQSTTAALYVACQD